MSYKVAIIAQMPRNSYSGGRTHPWFLAEAIATAGNKVCFYTNNIPIFIQDFLHFPAHKEINIVCLNSFQELEKIQISVDYVICIPSVIGQSYFNSCLLFSLNNAARFILLNFETPNWFEQYGRINLGPGMYKKMQEISAYGCLILSSANISMNYAKQFYNSEKTIHDVWNPPINTLVADSVSVQKENQIFISMRLSDKHKGGDILLKLLGEYLRDVTIVCMFGTSFTDEVYLSKVNEIASVYGIHIKPVYRISDKKKYEEIKRSKLLLFPSKFEGYGSPPVEALYCGTYVLAYDLPVIRETCGEAVDYCEPENIDKMKLMIQDIMNRPSPKQVIVDGADFIKQSVRIHRLLEKYEKSPILKLTDAERNKIIKKIAQQKSEECCQIPIIMNKIGMKLSSFLRDEDERLDKIDLGDKKIYLYGCGEAYRQLYPKYSRLLDIYGVIDADPKLTGTVDVVSKKYVIQSTDILKNENPDCIVILITPVNYIDSIISSIKKIGAYEIHSLCMIEMNAIKSTICK